MEEREQASEEERNAPKAASDQREMTFAYDLQGQSDDERDKGINSVKGLDQSCLSCLRTSVRLPQNKERKCRRQEKWWA